MKYSRFGKTGYNASVLTLGTWGMGGAGWDVYDDEVKEDAVRAALEQGINMIDTAPAYNGGEAERFLGRTLKKLGARDDVIITTKCGNYFVDNAYIRDSSPERIQQQCEDSLRNLQTDHIEIMLIHWPDPNVPFEATMEVLNRLKEEGKIGHIGVSNFTIEQMQEISQYGDIEVYEPPYSMINLSAQEIIRYAADNDMGIMAYGSLGGGILTGKIRSMMDLAPTDNRNRFYKIFQEPMFSKAMELLKIMDGVSERNGGLPLAQIALNWSCASPCISTSIFGAQKRERVLENVQSIERTINPEDIKLLNETVEKLFG